MNIVKAEELKKELLAAIKNNDSEGIEKLAAELNIGEEQKVYFSKGLTGFPSVDQVWLKYYDENAFEAGNDIPRGRTIWSVMEERFELHKDYPAIEYFGRKFSRKEYKEMVYTWAKAFKALGVKENEIVSFYCPFLPDIGAMAFALNMIGSVAYFLKLAIHPEALAEETKDSKVAVVFDGMWENVKHEFTKEKFEHVIIISVSDGMPTLKKTAYKAAMKIKNKDVEIAGKNIITVDEAKKYAEKYNGKLEADYVVDRDAFITSSSGTTVGGVVKGTVATNETTLTQIYMCTASKFLYFPGGRCLNNLPPTASTSLNALFFLPLFHGLTVIFDPRVSKEDFYRQITELKPNISITTGTLWELFFNKIKEDIKSGKKFDFSYSTGWVVGGEGIDSSKFNAWDKIMHECGAIGMCSGYGSSELFSSVSSDTKKALGKDDKTKGTNAVGVPLAGITVGIFDENGNELSYNQRGDLWVKSQSAMKCYYNKPELTAETIIDGWVHIGDLAEIDENGFLYIWGRVKDKYVLSNNDYIYLFDVANKIKENNAFLDAIVLPVASETICKSVVAHIVWADNIKEEEKASIMESTNKVLEEYLPEEVKLVGYYSYDIMLPYSPTTLKKDKNAMSKVTTGFFNAVDGKITPVNIV